MIESELHLLRDHPVCLAVLRAYAAELQQLEDSESEQTSDAGDEAAAAGRKATDADTQADAADAADAVTSDEAAADGSSVTEVSQPSESPRRRRSQLWVPRLTEVPGVDAEELSPVHGRLIAYGLLQCDLTDRKTGMVYQLTREARRALEKLAGNELAGGDPGGRLNRSA